MGVRVIISLPKIPEIPEVHIIDDLKKVYDFYNDVQDLAKALTPPQRVPGPKVKQVETSGSFHAQIKVEAHKENGGSIKLNLQYKF